MADKKGASGEKNLYCSFCGKSQHEVKKLIAGPSVFVCDECIDLCNEIIRDEVPSIGDTLGLIVTGHNLDDCVETYVWSSLHGQSKVIPIKRHTVVRPFLTTPKSEFVNWCERKSIEWCHDNSNDDTKYMRNYVRTHLMPHALHVNPGLNTVVKKIVERQ